MENEILKRCCSCKQLFPLNEFCKNKTKKDGHTNMCKLCRKEYIRKYYLERKDYFLENVRKRRKELTPILKQILEEFKSQPCEICGKTFPTCAMDCHHENRSDKKLISKIVHGCFSPEAIKKELSKCVPLCACCHRILHDKEIRKKWGRRDSNPRL